MTTPYARLVAATSAYVADELVAAARTIETSDDVDALTRASLLLDLVDLNTRLLAVLAAR